MTRAALILSVIILLTLFQSQAVKTSAQTRHQAGSGKARKSLIARVWAGRTPASKADEYYSYLVEAGIKKIQAIKGNLGVQVFKRIDKDIAEFTVISYWESLDAIRKFAGDDIEKTHHLPRDAEYLLELPPTVKHYEVLLNEPIKTARRVRR
jgi:heme-degrading monooxygenase HmoA